MLFETFLLPSLSSSELNETYFVTENFQITEALKNSSKEPCPLDVSISFKNSLTNDIQTIPITPKKLNSGFYEISVPVLEDMENVSLSFCSNNPEIPQMLDLLVPSTVYQIIRNNLVDKSIHFSLGNIVGTQTIFIINKPVFTIESENIKNVTNIILSHNKGNEELNNSFSYIDSTGCMGTLKIINKFGFLNTGNLTKQMFIKELLDKDLKIRLENTKTLNRKLKKALSVLKNINIRNSLRLVSSNSEVKPGCICNNSLCLNTMENSDAHKQECHTGKCSLNICPTSPIECLKYCLNTSINCFNIMEVLFLTISVSNDLSFTDNHSEKQVLDFLHSIDNAKDIFEVRVCQQLFLSEVNNKLDYRSINVAYDILKSKILQSHFKQPKSKDPQISEEQKKEDSKIEDSKEKSTANAEDNTNDKETEEDSNSEPSDDEGKPKSRKLLWISLGISAIVVISIVGYLFMM